MISSIGTSDPSSPEPKDLRKSAEAVQLEGHAGPIGPCTPGLGGGRGGGMG